MLSVESRPLDIKDSNDGPEKAVSISVKGVLPSGSLGNEDVNQANSQIEKLLVDIAPDPEGDLPLYGKRILLDLTQLDYEYGDSVATLWLKPIMKGAVVVVVAQGRTRKSLLALIVHSVKIPILESQNEAIEELMTLQPLRSRTKHP